MRTKIYIKLLTTLCTFILLLSLPTYTKASTPQDDLVAGYAYLRVNMHWNKCYEALSTNYKKFVSEEQYQTYWTGYNQVFVETRILPVYIGSYTNITLNNKIYEKVYKYSLVINRIYLVSNRPAQFEADIYIVPENGKWKIECEANGDINASISTIYSDIGNISMNQGNYIEAIKNFKKGISFSNDYYNYLGVAICYSYEELHEDAQQYIDKALRYAKDDKDKSFIQTNHAIILENQKKYSQAIDTYQKALTLDPENEDAHIRLLKLKKRVKG